MVAASQAAVAAATAASRAGLLTVALLALTASALVTLTCNSANTIVNPGAAETYQLVGCVSTSTTTITIQASTSARTVNIQASGAGSPCYLQRIVVQGGAQSNLVINLQGVVMQCTGVVCIDMSAATLTSVTVAATAFPSAPVVTNVISSTANGVITTGAATGFSVTLDNTVVTSATNVIRFNGIVASLSVRVTGSTIDAGSSSFLSAVAAVSSVDIGINSANLGSVTTRLSSTAPVFSFNAAVTAPFALYSGPGTTFVGQAAATRFLYFGTLGTVSSGTVSISATSLSFPTTTTCLICADGTLSGWTMSIYGSSIVTVQGTVLSVAGAFVSSTVNAIYGATSTVQGAHLVVDTFISNVGVTFQAASLFTSTGIVSSAALTTVAISCVSIASSSAVLTVGGAGTTTGVTLDATGSPATGYYVHTSATVSLTALAVRLTSSGMTNAALPAFAFDGPVASSTITLTSSTVTASKYIACLSSVASLSVYSLSSSFVTTTNVVVSLGSATLASSNILISATGSSTFSGSTFMTAAYDTTLVSVFLQSSSKLFASTSILSVASGAVMNSFTIVGGTSATITTGSTGFQLGIISFLGIHLTASGAVFSHTNGLPLISVTGTSVNAVISVASGATISSPASALFKSTGSVSADVMLTVIGGTVNCGQMVLLSGALGSVGSNFVVTTSSSAVVTFSSVALQSNVAVTGISLDITDSTTLRATSGLLMLTSGTVTYNTVSVTLTDLHASSFLDANNMIACTASPISILSVRFSGVFLVKTTQAALDIWQVVDGVVSISGGFTISSQSTVISTMAQSLAVSVVSSSALQSATGDVIVLGGSVGFTLVGSSAAFSSASARFISFAATASSVLISMTACTITAGTSNTGALLFSDAASDITVIFESATVGHFAGASFVRFVGTLSGTNVISITGGSVNGPTGALVQCDSGFQGTSMSVLLSSTTITAANFLVAAEQTATSLGSVFSITGSSITISTTAASSSPSIVYVANAPKMLGVLWTITNCAIKHVIPIVPSNDVVLSFYTLIGSSVSITNSIGPSFVVLSTSITSTSSYLSTFIGLRFDGTGIVQGNSNPTGTVTMERLTHDLSTTRIALVATAPAFAVNYMVMTFQCIDVATTSTPLVYLRGYVDQGTVTFVGVQLRQTLSLIAAIDASTVSTNRYIKVTLLNSHLHAPVLIGLHPTLLIPNPVPPSTIEITIGCSKVSDDYAMAAGSFGTPLLTAVQTTTCTVNKYLNCLDTSSQSKTFSSTVSLSPSSSLTPTASVTGSLSSDVTQSYQRTWSNYSYSNSSELSMSDSKELSQSASVTHSDEVTQSRSITASSSVTPSASSTLSSSSSVTGSSEVTPSVTYTGTVSLSRGTPTATIIATPSNSTTASPTEERPSVSPTATPSSSPEPSPSTSVSNAVTLSGTHSNSKTPTFTPSDEVTRSRTPSYTQTPSALTPTEDLSATHSYSVTHSISISPSVTEVLTHSDSTTVSDSVSLSDVDSLSVSQTLSRSITTSSTHSVTEGTLSTDPTLSASPSKTGSVTKSVSSSRVSKTMTPTDGTHTSAQSASWSFSDSLSTSFTPEHTGSPSDTASASPTRSSTLTLSDTELPSHTKSGTRTSSVSQSSSGEVSRSASPTPSRSLTVTRSPSPSGGTPSMQSSASPSVSQTITATEVTWSKEFTSTTTKTNSMTVSEITSDQTLTATVEVTSPTSTPSFSKEVTLTVDTFTLTQSPEATASTTPTGSRSQTQSVTVTATESDSFSASAAFTYTGLTKNPTPSRETLTATMSQSPGSWEQSKTVSLTRNTPSRSLGSVSFPQSMTESNSSSVSQEKSKSRTYSPGTLTRTVTSSESTDLTLTVTRTITPPKTITSTRTISRGPAPPLSNLQQIVGFFDDFLSDGQQCTSGLWYVLAVCLLLLLLEMLILGWMKLMGRILEKHPDTVDGITVWRSLVARSVYLGALFPCHHQCAMLHSLIAVLHISIIITLYYIVSVRLYLSAASPNSLRVIVALSCAVAPHIVTNPLRQLMFRFQFNEKKLEKAWLKYCDITGRHQSKEYYATVKDDEPLQKVLALSKSKVDPSDPNVVHHRLRHEKEVQWRKTVEEDNTFEFSMQPQEPDQKVMRVMSMRRGPGDGGASLDSVGPKNDDDDDEQPQITIVTEARPVKKKKKKAGGKKKKKAGTAGAGGATTAPSKPPDDALLGIGIFTESDSDASFNDEFVVGGSKPSPSAPVVQRKKNVVKKNNKRDATPSPTIPSLGKLSDDDGEGVGAFGLGGGNNADVSSIDMNAIFGAAAMFTGSSGTGGGGSSKPSSRGDPKHHRVTDDAAAGGGARHRNGDDLASFVPSIVVSVPADRGSLMEEYNLDLSFSDIGDNLDDDVEILAEEQFANSNRLLGAQREVLAAFATPRGSPSLSSGGASVANDGGGTKKKKKRSTVTPPPPPVAPHPGTTAFKLLHGIEDPFHVSSSDEDEDAARFRRASGPNDLFSVHDPHGFARAATADSATGSGGGAADRRSSSFKLHPLKDSITALVEGSIANKVVQHNLEDRWEARSDEWSLPSASDSTDTDGDDEEGREYFPAPILTYFRHIGGVTMLLLVGTLLALFFTIRGVEQPSQLCITDFVYLTFLIDFFVIEACAAGLVLFYRVWTYNEDGSHDRKEERHSCCTAIRTLNCNLHPFAGELKEHILPPLRQGKKRRVRDQPYAFGVPAQAQPNAREPKPYVEPARPRLPKWEIY